MLPRDEQNIEQALREQLARRGWPVRYENVRWSGRDEDQPELVERLRRLAPDLIYTWGTPTTLAVAGPVDGDPARFVRDRPIVFTEVTDPVGSRLVNRLDPPGRNLTGVRHVAPLATQLAALRSYRPFHRIGVIVNPDEPNTVLVRDALGPLAAQLGLEIVDAAVPPDATGEPDPRALPDLIRGLAQRGAEVLYLGPSTFLALTHRDAVTRAARDARLPTFCVTESVAADQHAGGARPGAVPAAGAARRGRGHPGGAGACSPGRSGACAPGRAGAGAPGRRHVAAGRRVRTLAGARTRRDAPSPGPPDSRLDSESFSRPAPPGCAARIGIPQAPGAAPKALLESASRGGNAALQRERAMAFVHETVGTVEVIRPRGRLDSANAPELEAALRALLAGGAKQMLFDLSELDYISSAGLRVVLLAGKGLRAAQGRLVLAGVGGMVREVFEMSGFLNLFPVVADARAGLAAF